MWFVAVLAALALALAAVVVVVVVVAARARAELRRAVTEQQATALRQAVEHLVVVSRDALSAQAAQHDQQLEGKKALIDAELGTLHTELQRVQQLVADLGRTNAERFGQFSAQLSEHAKSTSALAASTQSLREALANTKARGQWGERMAEDVLRLAGFVEHVNYEKQRAVEHGRSIPDFTFLLPKGHVLYMDVKFPLSAYLRYLDATTDAERSAARNEFLRDVRLRVRELARRDYLDRSRPTVDQLLLFIPNEAVSGFIHEEDPGLIDEALEQKIIFCSPLTLFAMLGVIRQAFDNFVIEQTSSEILRLMGAFASQYERYSGAVETVGKRIDSLQRAFEELNGPRRRQLEKPLGRIEELRRQHGLAAAPDLVAGAEIVELDQRELEVKGGQIA